MQIDCLYTGLFLGLSWIESLLSYSDHHVNTIFFQKCILPPKNNPCNLILEINYNWIECSTMYCYICFKIYLIFVFGYLRHCIEFTVVEVLHYMWKEASRRFVLVPPVCNVGVGECDFRALEHWPTDVEML